MSDAVDLLCEAGFYEGMVHFPSVAAPAGTLTDSDLDREVTIDTPAGTVTGRLHARRENPDGTLAVTIITAEETE